MTIGELIKDIHNNAVNHGWWETERNPDEIIALIHNEWSEALEEARKDKPLHYYSENEWHKKPEGIAVELIDGCIRIMDYLGHLGGRFAFYTDACNKTLDQLLNEVAGQYHIPSSAASLVAALHYLTANAHVVRVDSLGWLDEDKVFESQLVWAMIVAMTWIKLKGEDPEKLLLEKHNFNKTREYKHGKKF